MTQGKPQHLRNKTLLMLIIIALVLILVPAAVFATGGADKNPGDPVFKHAETLWDYYGGKNLVPSTSPLLPTPINGALLDYFPSDSSSGTGVFNTYLALKAPGSSVEERGVNTDAIGNQKFVFDEDGSKTKALPLSAVPVVDINGTLYREFCVDINQLTGLGHVSLEVFQIWQTNNQHLIGKYDAATHTLADSTLVWDLDGGFRSYSAANKTIILDYAVNTGSGKPDYKLFVPNEWFNAGIQYVAMACDHGYSQVINGGVTDPVTNTLLPVGCNDGFEEWGVRVITPAAKSGTKFNDQNNNGIRDAGEPGLSGWVIYVDYDNDGVMDPSLEPYVTTGADGSYTITGIVPGTWKVREVSQAGWVQTLPGPLGADGLSGTADDYCYVEEFLSGANLTGNDFGNFQLKPAINIIKTGDALSKVGDPVNYTITVQNLSPTGTPDLSVHITDAMLDIDETMTMAAGAPDYVIHKSYIVPAGAPDPLENTAYATATCAGYDGSVSDIASCSTNLFQPGVMIDKTADPLSKIGDDVTYHITITNTSSSDSPNLILDSIVDSLKGDIASLAAGADVMGYGESVSFTYTRTVASGDPDPLVNSVTVHYHPAGFPNDITAADTASTNLFQPSITITKTGDELSKVGDPIHYIITVTNTSSPDSPNLVGTVVDPLTELDEEINLAPGASVTFNPVYVVQSSDPDPLTNTATVTTSPVGFPNVISASSTWTTNLFQPSIEITKTGDELSKVGDPINYVITIINTSSSDSPNLVGTVVDPLTGLDEEINLAPGASVTFNPIYVVQADDPDPLTNTATVITSPVGFPNAISASSTWTTNLFQPSIEINKTGDELSKVDDPIHYIITVTNTSSPDSPNLVGKVTDPMLELDQAIDLAPGASVTFTRDYTVQPGDPDPLTNTAAVTTSPVGFPNVISDKASWTTNLFQPSIEITKTGDALSKVGDPINYVITAINTSSPDSPNLVGTVVDPLTGLNEEIDLVPGASVTFNPIYIVQTNDPDPLTNTATVTTSPVGFPNVISASASWTTNLFQPSIEITKTGDALSKVGDPINYVITVTNTSSPDSPNLVGKVTDPMLELDREINLAPGTSVTISRDYTVKPGDPDPLPNTVTVTTSPVGFPNVISASASWTINLFQPSITISKTGDELSKVGDPIHYIITVTNTSSPDSPNLVGTVVDPLTGLDEEINLASGASVTFNPVYVVQSGDSDPLTNTVTVSTSPVGFPNVISASSSWTTNLFQPSVSLTKEGDKTEAMPGDWVHYVITVTNTSSLDAPNLVGPVTDTLLGDLGIVDLAPGGSSVFTYDYQIPLTTPPGTYINNTAAVTASPAGFPNIINASDSWSVHVLWRGFTPGYWKTHPEEWYRTPYSTAMTVKSIFTIPSSLLKSGKLDLNNDGKEDTLMDALNYQGGSNLKGKAANLLRAAVAALLNEAALGDSYPPYSNVNDLIAAVNTVLASEDKTSYTDMGKSLDGWNNGIHEFPTP